MEHSGNRGEPIAWISRDHVPNEPVIQPAAGGAGSKGRLKWTLGAVALAVALAIGGAVWMSRATNPKTAPVVLADTQSIPLVSVLVPGVSAVTSNVTFTGAISARYDMPIGIDGDAGRIVAIYVEAGDHV